MKSEVIQAIDNERAYQEQKWPNHRHTTGEWILIMSKCLDDARRAWVAGRGDDAALHEIRQVVAVGVAAMEQRGAPLRGVPVQDEINRRCPACGHVFAHCTCQKG